MARGYPDFFGMSIFPSYGPLKSAGASGTIDADSMVSIPLVTGKGRVRAIEFIIYDSDAYDDVGITPIVDGLTMDSVNMGSINPYDTVLSPYAWMRTVLYDVANTMILGRMLEDITYGQSIVLQLTNTNTLVAVAYGMICWYHDYISG